MNAARHAIFTISNEVGSNCTAAARPVEYYDLPGPLHGGIMIGLAMLQRSGEPVGIRRGHIWLCCAPLLLRALDYGITLFAQSTEYWAGDYGRAVEGSPVLRWCLEQHPLMFVAVALALTVPFVLFILCWPERPARLLAGVLVVGHFYGVASWVFESEACGPTVLVALLYFCGSLIETTWRKQSVLAAEPAFTTS
jgi:hypothetical protein